MNLLKLAEFNTVAWTSKNQDGDGKGIFAQRFDGPMTKRDIGAVASPPNNGGSADKLGPHALDALAQNVAKLGRELALKFEAVDAAPRNRGLARRIDYGVVDDGERPWLSWLRGRSHSMITARAADERREHEKARRWRMSISPN